MCSREIHTSIYVNRNYYVCSIFWVTNLGHYGPERFRAFVLFTVPVNITAMHGLSSDF